MKRKNIAFMVSSVILLTSIIFIVIYYKPHRSVRGEDPAYSLTVQQLVNAFSANEMRADSMYVGAVLELEGRLKEMILNDSTLILLLGDSTQMTGVSCYLNKSQKEKYTSIKRGEIVKVKGICNGMLLDIVMDKCILLPEGAAVETGK